MCGSGELTEPFRERDFEPFDSRKVARQAGETKVTDPEGEALEDVIAFGINWAKRHKALKAAQKDLRDRVGKDKKTTLLCEAIVLLPPA